MMNFSTTYTLESKSCAGVTVTLRRLGPKRRAEIELSIAAARARHSECQLVAMRENAALQKCLDAVPEYRDKLKATIESGGKPTDLMAMVPAEAWNITGRKQKAEDEAAALERAQISPAYITSCVKSIDGITLEDGSPYTVAHLCEEGPDELFDEVTVAINANGYLAKEKAENLSSPTTSGVQGDGGQTITTAQAANPDTNSTGV